MDPATQDPTTAPDAAAAVRAPAGDYLAFVLAGELHAVPVAQVYGVLALPAITPVPNLPAFLCGVIHHEGAIMPVMDLALRLGMPMTEHGPETCVVLVRVPHGGRTLAMGLVVAEVQDVLPFTQDRLLPPPEFGLRLDTRFLLGMARGAEGAMTLLIDMERVLDERELAIAAGAVS